MLMGKRLCDTVCAGYQLSTQTNPTEAYARWEWLAVGTMKSDDPINWQLSLDVCLAERNTSTFSLPHLLLTVPTEILLEKVVLISSV